MTNVINLAEKRAEYEPTLEGSARCLSCKHEWTATAPVGTTRLECPSCGLFHGAFVGMPHRDEDYWICLCGSDLFRVYADNSMNCARCGLPQVFD